ncbi:MAG TPA: UxaA family hydrolase [Candidatus Caccovicinus merdipullorum]|uniref:UxaA family hydrolase n=1 Tax=Candidatus Caccovicinus merdipullorum TaxID=2840724 RepID=A0A9D1KG27_9FIRM|nr:UxaA family hydrolase [Candidatus Caccovicinus merdipullorum]
MEINALLMDPKDNVVTCVAQVEAGSQVVYRNGDQLCCLKAEETIPFCHKIALEDLKKGDEVMKYGELIGKTSCDVAKGHWISHENIYSVPRDYESEMVKEEE